MQASALEASVNELIDTIFGCYPSSKAASVVSQAELEGNRIVLNATKQAPAPQAPKILGRASQPKEAWK